MATRLWGYRDGEPWIENPLAGSAGLAGGSLAVWNPHGRRRKRRRGNTMARRRRTTSRRRRRNMPMRRRRARVVYRHARRRNQPAVPFINRPRRRRAGVGFLPGLPPVAQMLPPVGAGIGGGLLVGWGTPMVLPFIPGLVPAGFMYRLLQAGIAWVGAWALASFRMVDRGTAVAFGTGGSVVAGLGLISDWQRGLVGGFAAAAPAPAVSGLGQEEEEYDAMMGYYEPYGVGPTMGYYEAVA